MHLNLCQLFSVIGVLSLLMYLHLMWLMSRIIPARKASKSDSETISTFLKDAVIEETGFRRSKGRLFCWIMTHQNNYFERAKYLEETWPRRCDRHFFFTDNNTGRDERRFINVFHGLTDGYDNLWPKTEAAMRYIYKHYLNDYDWFLKADDDTYVIVENLRAFLGRFNKSGYHFIGHKLRAELPHGHNSGGAGYILSRSALKLLAENLSNKTICPGGWAEDTEVARCLENVGIYPENTQDNKQRYRFVHMHPAHYMYQLLGDTAKELISPELISMHQLTPVELRLIDLVLYHVRRPDS